jgi:hypothetical protein
MKLDTLDDQLMAQAAVGYCVGRQTYMVDVCAGWVRATWGEFTPRTKSIILRDVVRELLAGRAGSESDAFVWQELARWMYVHASYSERDLLSTDARAYLEKMCIEDAA